MTKSDFSEKLILHRLLIRISKGGKWVDRVELISFLKEVLRVCGESVTIEIARLEKISSTVNTQDEDFQLVLGSGSDLPKMKCLNQVVEKFGMKMEKQGEFWIFSKK
jgi:hypothetical protein